MTQQWHVPGPTLRAYVDERLPDAQAWSIEAHLIECVPCRRRISEAAEVSEVSAIVRQVQVNLSGELPAQGAARRGTLLRRVWIMLSTAPGARGAWLLAVFFALASTVGLDLSVPNDAVDWWSRHGSALLLIAPILPVLGVAASYGGIDPAREITASTASGGLRLVLWRTLSVVLVAVPGAAVVGAFVGKVSLMSWLLPCAALTCLTLALGSVIRLEIAAASVAVSWLVLATAPLLTDDVPVLLAEPLPVLWAVVIGASLVVLRLRRSAFDHAALSPNRS